MPRLALACLTALVTFAARPAAASPCELRGAAKRLEVRVTAPGHPTFSVSLKGLAVVARFGEAPFVVETEGPLRLRGTTRVLPLALARPVIADAGRIQLSTAVQVQRARATRDGIQLTVAIASDSSIGARVSPVHVGCDDVRVGDTERATKIGPAMAVTWFARPRSLALRDRPNGPRRTRVVAAHPLALPLEQVERRAGWVHVRAAWTDGSAVTGWAPRSALSPAPAGLLGWGTGGPHGTASCKRSLPTASPNGYVGPATLRADATIHAAPAGSSWADAREDLQVEVAINDLTRDTWVRVLTVPGVSESCDQLEHAWVRREALVIP